MAALPLVGVLAVLVGCGAMFRAGRRGTVGSRMPSVQLSAGVVFMSSSVAVDLVRSLLPGRPVLLLALLAIGVVACLLAVGPVLERRSEVVLDGALVAAGVVLVVWVLMGYVAASSAVSTSAASSGPAVMVFADVVGLSVVTWQKYLVTETGKASIRVPRNLHRLMHTYVCLRVGAWVCFNLETGTGVAAFGLAALVLVGLTHLLRGVYLVRQASGESIMDKLSTNQPSPSRVPYLVAALTLIVLAPALVSLQHLLSPMVMTLGLLWASALLLRQVVTHARLRRVTGDAQAREQYFARLLADSSDIIMIADRAGTLGYVGPSAERVLGPGMAVVGEAVWTALAVPSSAFTAALGRLDHGSTTELIEGRREHLVMEAAMSLRGNEVLVSVRDVTERDRLRQRLHYLAYHDPLTGLANRSRVLSRISAMLSRNELCAVLFVDLDRFKQVNDNSGHATGDQVLQQVSHRLAELVRSGDLIGRLGGDEFIAVLSVGQEEAQAVATRIRDVLSTPFEVGGREYQLGVSIGIAVGVPGLLPEDLLRRADLAMYAAKRQRGSWVVYEAGLGRAALAQANIDVAVSKALRDRDMDIFLQPLVDLSNGKVVTVEALLRWRNDAGQMCPPAEMLDFARRSGRMGEVTSWVLERGVEILAASRSGVALAVNMPPEMLLVPGISRHLTALLDLHGVPASRLEIEVTEDQLLEQAATSSTILQRLRDLGMPVMIDDFGTGFSSLGYLLDLPIDGLKIDQRFTKVLPHSESARSIVGGLVGIASRLNLRVVAEGIENADQHEWARRLGVHVGQGYWYARPEAARVLGDLGDLRSWSSSSAGAAWTSSVPV